MAMRCGRETTPLRRVVPRRREASGRSATLDWLMPRRLRRQTRKTRSGRKIAKVMSSMIVAAADA